ncbi:glutathione peroxidase [Shimia ponticola]|uniref:glutathione peroxidase n=1 Tax=Shimia ponticola TaxID=2582893 RepID=UPI002106E84E|nr:glutathione peroxidase [Shimia ponticola]
MFRLFRVQLLSVLLVWMASAVLAEEFTFDLMTGEKLTTQGQPTLIVNTASKCAFTRQYDELQVLYDRFRDRGFQVVAVPSDSFRQELATDDQVADFCAINFDLDVPMTSIASVTGPDAHPFYRWMEQTEGFVPRWNFNKVLLDANGDVVGTWDAPVRPTSRRIVRAVEGTLATG